MRTVHPPGLPRYAKGRPRVFPRRCGALVQNIEKYSRGGHLREKIEEMKKISNERNEAKAKEV